MKNWKKYLSLVLALVLCLTLAACGGDSGSDYNDNDSDDYDDYSDTGSSAPESFEGMVKDSQLLTDYAMYYGTWIGEDNSELIVEMNDSGDEVRYALYDVNEDLTASGYIQVVLEYSADYFYNEHDGVAHHSWLDEDGTLQVDSFGAFTKVSGDVPGENIGDTGCEALAGVWFLDGEANAASIIEIGEGGRWSLSERPNGDGDPAEVDCGTIEMNPDGEDQYFAVSTMFDDVVYDMTVIGDDVMYWGGENDYYQKMA